MADRDLHNRTDKEKKMNKLLILSFVNEKLMEYPDFKDIVEEIQRRMEILFNNYKNGK
jgi:hypothetical protein